MSNLPIKLLSLIFVSFSFQILALPPSDAPIESPKTFLDCFRAAMKRSETIGTQVELINQAEQNYKQSVGSILPNVTGGIKQFWQQSSTNALGQALSQTNQHTIVMTATQPLFQGFREFAAMKQTRLLKDAQVAAKRQASIQLYQDTATSYYNVLSVEKDIQNLSTEIGDYEKRAKELKEFVHIGRSAITDLLTTQSSQATLEAQLEQLRGQAKANRESLAFLTGFHSDILLLDDEAMEPVAVTLDHYVAQEENRPDVMSSRATQQAAESNIWVAKSAHLPTLNFTGDYYPVRPSPEDDVNWDAEMDFVLPIFSGGVTQSKVEVAESQQRQAILALSQTLRTADEQIKTNFDTFESDQKQLDAYTHAVDLAKKNYEQEEKDYRSGLVSNLDVLTALSNYEENQRALDRTRYTAKIDFAKLESSAGNFSNGDIE